MNKIFAMQVNHVRTHYMMFDVMVKYIRELKAMTMHKLYAIILTSGVLVYLEEYVNKYIFNDWNYLHSLFILILVDTISGGLKAWSQKNNFGSMLFGMMFAKIFLYSLILITVSVLISFKVGGVHPIFFDWINVFVYSGLMLRETISIFENISIVYPNLLPKYIMNRLKKFDEEGFKEKEDKK